MSRNEISRELSEVHPMLWIFFIALGGAAVTAWWNKSLGPIVKNTIEAVKNGEWTRSVGELPGVGEVTAVTVVGVAVAAVIVLFLIGRGIRAMTTGRARRGRDEGDD